MHCIDQFDLKYGVPRIAPCRSKWRVVNGLIVGVLCVCVQAWLDGDVTACKPHPRHHLFPLHQVGGKLLSMAHSMA